MAAEQAWRTANGGAIAEPACTDPVVLDLWHAIGAVNETFEVQHTELLGQPLAYRIDAGGTPQVRRHGGPGDGGALPARIAYGYVWCSLGTPANELFPIPEYEEEDRRNLNAASIGVHVSAPRAIENFLDLGHFPFVHTDILGVEPHTEVREYRVEVSEDNREIVATNCMFYQPKAAATSEAGADVEYVYRVPHPFCSVLYKSSPLDPERMDVIALFCQPLDEQRTRAHMLLSILDEGSEDRDIRAFQQMIFGQDKPILENQFPKKLPLDPRAETPIRADKSAIFYRRWLSDLGLTYGVVPAAS